MELGFRWFSLNSKVWKSHGFPFGTWSANGLAHAHLVFWGGLPTGRAPKSRMTLDVSGLGHVCGWFFMPKFRPVSPASPAHWYPFLNKKLGFKVQPHEEIVRRRCWSLRLYSNPAFLEKYPARIVTFAASQLECGSAAPHPQRCWLVYNQYYSL